MAKYGKGFLVFRMAYNLQENSQYSFTLYTVIGNLKKQ